MRFVTENFLVFLFFSLLHKMYVQFLADLPRSCIEKSTAQRGQLYNLVTDHGKYICHDLLLIKVYFIRTTIPKEIDNEKQC